MSKKNMHPNSLANLRPPAAPGEARNTKAITRKKIISVKVTEEEHAHIFAAAAEAGYKSASKWLRDLAAKK